MIPRRVLAIINGETDVPLAAMRKYQLMAQQRWDWEGAVIPEVPQGPGDHLMQLIKQYGFRAAPGCECWAHAAAMNEHGPAWCRNNLDTITSWLKAEHQRSWEAGLTLLPFSETIARRLIMQAITKAEAAAHAEPGQSHPTDQGRKQAKMKTVRNWAVGITTAPRQQPQLLRCIKSVRDAGWEPIVFAEPGTDLSHVDCRVVQRKQKLGAWHNWKEMCWQLLDEHPEAEAILTIQDDTIFHPDTREFLEQDLWPRPPAEIGYVSLYCSTKYQWWYTVQLDGQELSRHLSWKAASKKQQSIEGAKLIKVQREEGQLYNVAEKSLWGACALVFPPANLKRMINSKTAKQWRGASKRQVGSDIKNVDTAIGHLAKLYRYHALVYYPSLAQHVAPISSLPGHGGMTGKRSAGGFSEQMDLAQMFSQQERIRYGNDGLPHLTGDEEFDAAVREYLQVWNYSTFSINQQQWSMLRPHLRPGMRTLEFGSGLSTLLFRNAGCDHTAIEQNRPQAEALGAKYAPLGNGGWYTGFLKDRADLILVDGPYDGDRYQAKGCIDQNPQAIVVIDDCERTASHELVSYLTDNHYLEDYVVCGSRSMKLLKPFH